MKRSPLLRSTPLARVTPLRSRPKLRVVDPARDEWKRPRYGRCENCGHLSTEPLHGHHVLSRQMIRRWGGNEWDPVWRMDLDATCHFNHEFGQENRKIRRDRLPEAAMRATLDLLGEELGMAYLLTRYADPEVGS